MKKRLDKLERSFLPEEKPVVFSRCTAPAGLSDEEHERYHTDRGEGMCFTLNLGNCEVSGDD